MIALEMYINDELIEVVKFGTNVLPRKYQCQLKTLISQLKKKHMARAAKYEAEPVFVLTGVPSAINQFTPLHPSLLARGTNSFVSSPAIPSNAVQFSPESKSSEAFNEAV